MKIVHDGGCKLERTSAVSDGCTWDVFKDRALLCPSAQISPNCHRGLKSNYKQPIIQCQVIVQGNEKKKGNGAKEGKDYVKEDLKNDKVEEEEWNTKADVKKYVYPSYASVSEYAYPPQLFSDENPNACSIM